jgi:hypothetical protein
MRSVLREWILSRKRSLRRFVAGRPTLYRLLSFAVRPRFWLFSLRSRPLDVKSDILVLRGHHLLCLTKHHAVRLYHPPVQLALAKIRTVPGIRIKTVVGPDDVCTICPYWRQGRCRRGAHMEESNARRDAEYLEALGLQDGQVIDAQALFDIMRRKLDVSAVKRICAGCTAEVCHEALQRKTWWQ